jgi:hypothetical protein
VFVEKLAHQSSTTRNVNAVRTATACYLGYVYICTPCAFVSFAEAADADYMV